MADSILDVAIEKGHERLACMMVRVQPELAWKIHSLFLAFQKGLVHLVLLFFTMRHGDEFLLERRGASTLLRHLSEFGASIYGFVLKFVVSDAYILDLCEEVAKTFEPDDPVRRSAQTLLISALKERRFKVVKGLLEMDSKHRLFSLSATDEDGKGALQLAFDKSAPRLFLQLVAAGCEPFLGRGNSEDSVDSPLLYVVRNDSGERKASRIIFEGITNRVPFCPNSSLARKWRALQSALARRVYHDGKESVQLFMSRLGKVTACTCQDFTNGVVSASSSLPPPGAGAAIKVDKRVAAIAEAILEACGEPEQRQQQQQPRKRRRLRRREGAASSSSSSPAPPPNASSTKKVKKGQSKR